MKVIETESCYLVMDKEHNKVTKIFKTYWMRKCPWLIKNEVRALRKLDSKHFPAYLSHDDNSVTMTYAGKSLSSIKPITTDCREFTEKPEDFEEQVEQILNELEYANLRHSDINTGHLLVKDGIVMLIDFELCLEKNEPEPINYPKTAGVELKVRMIEEPIDDRLMAKRTVAWLNGGINKINNLIRKEGLLYHELPFKVVQSNDRKFLKQRINMMKAAYDFKGKKGLDLGCNIGGISFSLAINGAKMTGVERHDNFLEIARACEDYYSLGCSFVHSDITDYCLANLSSSKNSKHFDFCIFLATWHWVLKSFGLPIATDILKRISESCDVMFFETNFGSEEGLVGSEDTMVNAGLTDEKKLIEFIKKNTKYTNVKVIGKCIGWGNRPTYICSK